MPDLKREIEKAYHWLWKTEISDFASSVSPSAIVFVGQPGAGKTILSNYFSEVLSPAPYLINGDAYRKFHPSYRAIQQRYGSEFAVYTSDFSNLLVETVLRRCAEKKKNIIIEGTGRKAEVPIKTAQQLKRQGYHVELAGVAVRPEWSLLGVWRRYLSLLHGDTIPRGTAKESHDYIVAVLPDNLDQILQAHVFDRIRLFDRNTVCIYDSETEKVQLPSQVLKVFWSRPWTEEEKFAYRQELQFLREHLGDVEEFLVIDFPDL